MLATLRITVALECWGAAAARLSHGSDFGLMPFLRREAGFDALTSASLLDNCGWGLAACGFLTLFRPCWPVLLPVTAWFALIAAIGPLSGLEPYRPVTHAVRYLAPFALLLLDFWPPRLSFSLGRAMVALILLRLGIVLSLLGQGWLALGQSRTGGPLVRQLQVALHSVFRWTTSADQAQTALGIVGGVLMGLAIGLLLVRSRGIALLIAICGSAAAMTYVIAGGNSAWDQTLLHAAPAGSAFTIFLYWWLAVREQPAITVPA